MKKVSRKGKIIIPADRKPWPHELRVASILASAGYDVEFLLETNMKRADILLNSIEFEIKSPRSANINSLEHTIKKALKQSPNIIIDSYRIKNFRDDNLRKFLINQIKVRKQIKRLILITKSGKIIDIFAFIR